MPCIQTAQESTSWFMIQNVTASSKLKFFPSFFFQTILIFSISHERN